MRYKGKVYRPPSEAYSLIVQVTYGCSHNTCAFCDMYDDKHFAIRPMEEVREDFEMARRVYKKVERVFLADGDALIRKASELYTILDTIRELFPECERVTSYASPSSIRLRTDEELQTLRAKGLTMVYMGLESGSDKVLTLMRKGHPAAEIIEMGQKVRRSGMALSVTAITGLGGPELLEEHAVKTAEAFNAMNPEYIGMLTLMVEPGTPLYDWVHDGSFRLLDQHQVLKETELLVSHFDSPGSVFRMNHASNYLDLRGTLNQDQDALLAAIHKMFRGKRGGQLGIGILVGLMDISTANNTVAIVMAGPIAKEIATEYGISPKRSASLLDTFSCVFQGIIPYGAQMLVAISACTTLGFAVSAFEIIPLLFYPMLLCLSSLLFILFDKK